MAAPLVAIAAIAGFALVIVAIARLNGGRPVEIGGIFPTHGRNDWPRGVQEGDLPRFAVDHAASLRRSGAAGAATGLPRIEEVNAPHHPTPPIERIEAWAPRLAWRRRTQRASARRDPLSLL